MHCKNAKKNIFNDFVICLGNGNIEHIKIGHIKIELKKIVVLMSIKIGVSNFGKIKIFKEN
jgi:hypothetical protein